MHTRPRTHTHLRADLIRAASAWLFTSASRRQQLALLLWQPSSVSSSLLKVQDETFLRVSFPLSRPDKAARAGSSAAQANAGRQR